MTSVPIYKYSRIDEMTWYVWDGAEFDFVRAHGHEPVEASHRVVVMSVGGVVVQRVAFESDVVVTVHYFDVENVDEAVAWHKEAYPTARGNVWGVFKESGSYQFREGISIAQDSILRRSEHVDAKGDLISEAWFSMDSGDLLEMKGYEYGDDGELSATLLYGRDGALIDRYEEE
ncbi:hypothetical protein [Nocardia sp. NPDC058666]|uniref:hypothetical protein n=1 Tax=Nocardia sp. NPDC058666 TaxID=3346587 RepID=UPI003648FACB